MPEEELKGGAAISPGWLGVVKRLNFVPASFRGPASGGCSTRMVLVMYAWWTKRPRDGFVKQGSEIGGERGG
ncbi:uncharacterized protein ColSpa_08737 [Colletotrichum spaethianum]|uniref:Uncharacterized protein n=1 Tax=Colletotrichum spaethianum TaxID=700344 RepID=A0AA37UJQ4_9PEZI|nr:uncharacterized protein ColSpa_08737 [Colletotrichum spaethianum]GKT48556.1 hypothetical protein ColSpa_08737 [Colletotrichum spaethianum]